MIYYKVEVVCGMRRKRIVIFSGGTLGPWALAEVREGDVLVGADSGALYMIRHGLRPHLSIGDFDSVTAEELAIVRAASEQFQSCDPVMKDWTDTEMAFRWAAEQHPKEIILVGALGTRFDHTLANVHLLRKAQQAGIACSLVDQQNRITLIAPGPAVPVTCGRYEHVSLLPLSLEVSGVTLDGFQYPLHEATLQIGDSIGISNVLVASVGHIRIASGLLLCIQSSDEAVER